MAVIGSRVQHSVLPIIAVFYMLFIREYYGYTLRNRLIIALLMIYPIINAVMLLSGDMFYPYFSYFTNALYQRRPFPHLVYSPRPLFMVSVIYLSFCILWGLFIILRRFFESKDKLRKESGLFLLITILPMAAFICEFLRVTFFSFNISSLTLPLVELIFGFHILRFRMADWMPFARDSVLENINDAFILLDPQGCFLDANAVAQRYFPDLLNLSSGMPISRINGFPQDIVYGEKMTYEFSIRHEGSARYLRASKSPVRYGDQVVCICIMIYDVTEINGLIRDIERLMRAVRDGYLKERAQLSLSFSEYQRVLAGVNATLDMVSQYFEALPEAIAFLGSDGRIRYRNNSMELLALHHQIDLQKNILSQLLPEVKQNNPGDLAQGASNMYFAHLSLSCGQTNNDDRNYALSLLQIESGEEIVRYMLLLTDTTTLTRARLAAEDASRAKSEFLSNMSHEIRTPLNAVIGMTAIGKATTEIERKNYCLGKIEDASAHLLGVINDILDMSKIEAGKLELSPESFDFEKMLQRVVNVINFRVNEKQQKLTIRMDKNIPPMLVGDDQRLAQVITNLLSNAVKFTPEQGLIHLNARLVKEEDGISTIEIAVIDSGIGISEEQKSRLFTSFQQAEGSTSRRYGGTGLGLAISKRIIEMMGGKIWIDSKPGKGSAFTFTILAQHSDEKEQDLLNPGVNWKNIRVLAVDDDPETREYFTSLSQRFGIFCDIAASGEEAVNLIDRDGSYDIYFVDWKMPGMNGMELSRRIKARDAGKSVVTMISAAEWNSISKDAKSAGVDKFLSKPLFPSAIADLINECLGTSGSFAEESLKEGETVNFKGYRVLLVEDMEINREIVLALLEPTQLEIDSAENGAKALEVFSKNPERYDAIFMDVQMPEMDGYEATSRIRALESPQAKRIPIIAMTANVFREDIEKCLNSGMNDHVGKPLDLDEILIKLRKYLPKRRPLRPLE
jgi:signal transduction histidine kinase/DNA-binding response OmpR family regulator/PAS domain-containing protein